MSNELAYFRDTETGKVGQYPYAFAAIFPNLVEISETDADFTDAEDVVVLDDADSADFEVRDEDFLADYSDFDPEGH